MNYFELHIGDLTEATAHLSMLEDGAYGRLMRKYYATEKPLPSDLKAVHRLIGARSKHEIEAVENVLHEFFELQDDGWHQSRCDAEIAAYHEKMIGKEGVKEGAKERQRRARERRKSLFEQLRGHGKIPAYSTTTVELELMLSRVTGAYTSRDVTPPVTRDDTATQTPDTRHQSPIPDTNSARTIPTGEATKAMREAGIADANPSHPKLAALLQDGISVDELRSAAEASVQSGKGFAYALATAEGRRRDAAVTALPSARTGPAPRAAEPEWRREQRERMEQAAPYAVSRPTAARTTPKTFTDDEATDVLPLARPTT